HARVPEGTIIPAMSVKGGRWCCRGGLNSRPQPYQGCALPLSYGSTARFPPPLGGGEAGPMEKASRPVKRACTTFCNPPNRRPMDAKTEREKRLAEALRNNLRRRKEQAREKEADSARPESPQDKDR